LINVDERLALQIQAGDMAAMAQVVESHHRPLLGYLYHLVGGDLMLAEDLVQEAFLRMMQSIQKYEYPRPFKPWLYAIATNLARDFYKRAETRRTTGMDEDYVADSAPDEAAFSALEQQQVAQQLLALPAFQREVVILRYYHELSLNEIAEALNIPVGTVKSRLSIGLRHLRTLMETPA